MPNNKLSVLIPAKGCRFLYNTVEDLLAKAKGNIEVIVASDGEWPEPKLEKHDNLIIVHRGSVYGMREGINAAARIASGKYIMKCDDHCMFGEGFDEILKADCEHDWLAIPARYSLDADKWERTRGPVHYMYMPFPYVVEGMPSTGSFGRKWRGPGGTEGSFWHLEKERKDILIDDIWAFQGSCWFMHKNLFFDIECLDSEHYGNFYNESEELTFKVWLSGGRVIRNKKTWYAHLFRQKHQDNVNRKDKDRTRVWMADFWMNNRWPKQTRKFEWLVDKFGPMEGWPDDWQDSRYVREVV